MKILLIALSLFFISESFAETPIVYSRCDRTTEDVTLTADITIDGQTQSVTRTFTGLDVHDRMPDVRSFLSDFNAPCDLIYRDETGTETVIYDCSSTSTDADSCAALDPSVSFDGTKIAFSVFRGTLDTIRWYPRSQVFDPNAKSGENAGGFDLPNKRMTTTGAHLHFYDIATGQIDAIPFESGIYDAGPAFIDDNRIAFTSTRDGNRITKVFGTNNPAKGTRIWAMDLDGNNLDLASHHSLSQEQHPFMLKNGRLAYSSWQIFGGIPFRHGNGAAGGFTTLRNLFHIYSQNPDGSHNFPIYGQHSGAHYRSHFGADHKAAHFLTQTSDERIWTADYYRGSNKGLGRLVGLMQEPEGQEGINPHDAVRIGDIYAPHDVVLGSIWASSGDMFSKTMPIPEYYHPNYTDPLPYRGKIGHPAALPNNGLMMAWGKGACSFVASSAVFSYLGLPTPPATSGGGGAAVNVLTSIGLDTPGCDIGIYKATQIPSQHPSDLEMIVDSKEWHEIMARAVVPYSDIYGVSKPETIEKSDKRTTHAMLPKGTPFGLLGAASITDRETHPRGGIKFAGEHQFNLQGTDTIDYTDDELCGIRMLGVMPNRGTSGVDAANQIANVAGERLAILGEVSVRGNKDINGDPIIDPSGNIDTSFLLRMPANTPYLMQGIDCEGRTLNTDQTWQSLRPGEQKTCGGCHVHSKPSRITFDQSYAATNNYSIPTLGEGTVPLFNGADSNGEPIVTAENSYGLQVEFTRDIKPIFDQRCISCHGGATPAAGLPLDLTDGDNTTWGSTWTRLVADKRQDLVPEEFQHNNGWTFRRPQLTKYIRAFNSRGSLLYWKAANERTDNRLDTEYTDDIDFGVDHPTAITDQELGLLSRWIDLGAGGGPQEIKDTQKPTLHLAGTVVDNAGTKEITELRVGTVDLGKGINTASLRVCVDDITTCNDLSPDAQMHGITVVPLNTAITDPNIDIYAKVQDADGNETEVTRKAGWFLETQATTPTDNPLYINVGLDATVQTNQLFERTIGMAGCDNTCNWTVSWGDGTTDTGSVPAGSTEFNISHTYSIDQNNIVTVSIEDTVDDTISDSFDVTVTSTGIVITSPLPDITINEGETVDITVTFTDDFDANNNGWFFTMDWGNGNVVFNSTSSNTLNFSETFDDGPGTYNASIEIDDADESPEVESFVITVNDNTPSGTVTGPTESETGQEVVITVDGVATGAEYVTDWGDNVTNNQLTHIYDTAGNYTISVSVVQDGTTYPIDTHNISIIESFVPCKMNFTEKESGDWTLVEQDCN